jgi:coenzyme PQQ precursor peptide PqqA
MKIMRRNSWSGGYPAQGAAASICCRTIGPTNLETHMIWQTPQAQDFRFGFEITMYVAAR